LFLSPFLRRQPPSRPSVVWLAPLRSASPSIPGSAHCLFPSFFSLLTRSFLFFLLPGSDKKQQDQPQSDESNLPLPTTLELARFYQVRGPFLPLIFVSSSRFLHLALCFYFL
jgi:hypothetical protein